MSRNWVCALVAAALPGVATPPAGAWHDRGHMTVALIAYRQLDDGQKKKVQSILKGHPHFGEFLSASRPADAPRDEWAVMRAAVWPDWVKQHHKEYSKPRHHYVNLPVKRLGGASEELAKTIEKNIAELSDKPSAGQILTVLPERLKEVGGDATPAKQRAVALCWVLHLVGDIHQPLHAASLFTKDSPEGDHGGNASYVPWHGRPENLHSVWDGVVGWDEFRSPLLTPYGVVDLMARDFQKRDEVTAEERGVTKVGEWASESRDLAEKEAYSFGGAPLKVAFNFDRHHHLSAAEMTPLPDGYAKRARGVAEKRVALAGHRLADRLKEILP
jgi:hypothetical protein